MNRKQISLEQAQKLMLDILIEIDKICKKNNIPYWLDAGTLLGSVRHEGFIPWDDDVDICMLRADYFRFLDVCKHDLNVEYFCQTCDTDIEYPKRTIPCKIRKSKSYISEAEDVFYGTDKLDFHKGLYVDVFPMDYYGKSPFFRKKQRVFSVIYYLKTASIFINHKSLLRKILSKLFYYIPWSIIEKIKNKLINKYNRVNDEIIGYGIEIPNCNYFHKKSNIFPLSTVSFEGFEFSAPKNKHEYLTILYGENYMELPPVDKRRSHTVSIEIYE